MCHLSLAISLDVEINHDLDFETGLSTQEFCTEGKLSWKLDMKKKFYNSNSQKQKKKKKIEIQIQTARLLCPWSSPGKNTGLGSHSLLLGIFSMDARVKPGSPALQADYLLSEPPGKPQTGLGF